MHWRNSNFQIKYFIVGSCHTPDEAYRKLCELLEEREMALNTVKASALRYEYNIAVAESKINSSNILEQLEGKALYAELTANSKNTLACIEEAQREYNYIKGLIEEIQPLRKYSHLPDYEAHQIAQQEEWLYELMFRAENFLVSVGSIPHDHLATMRMHPEWNTKLNPYIKQLVTGLQQNTLELSTKQLLVESK